MGAQKRGHGAAEPPGLGWTSIPYSVQAPALRGLWGPVLGTSVECVTFREV